MRRLTMIFLFMISPSSAAFEWYRKPYRQRYHCHRLYVPTSHSTYNLTSCSLASSGQTSYANQKGFGSSNERTLRPVSQSFISRFGFHCLRDFFLVFQLLRSPLPEGLRGQDKQHPPSFLNFWSQLSFLYTEGSSVFLNSSPG